MSNPGTSTTAERRYRRLLRVLPFWYRERYAEEMVETYLAGGPDDGVRPGPAEIAATLRLAVTTRARRTGRPSTATLVLLAIAGSAALAAGSVARVLVGVSSRLSRDQSWSMGTDGRLVAARSSLGLGEIIEARGLVWAVVVGLLVVGLRRVGTLIAALVAVLDVGTAFSPFLGRDAVVLELALARTDARSALLPVVVVGALVLAASADGPRPGGRARLGAAGGAVAALAVGYVAVRIVPMDVSDATSWPVAAAGVAVAALAVLLVGRRLDPAWAATVLVLAGLVVLAGPLPAGSRFVAWRTEQTFTDGPFDPALVPGLVLGAVSVVLAAVAWFAAVDRRPDRPVRSGRRPDLVTG